LILAEVNALGPDLKKILRIAYDPLASEASDLSSIS
jgi:hypothetical protein